MTIDEATTILNKDIDDPGSVSIHDVRKAELLGIEALKRIKAQRLGLPVSRWFTLPGETEK